MNRCWVGKACSLEPHRESVTGDPHGKKEAQCCEPGSLRFDYRAFFFGSAFFCAELFFLVGLFFLGSTVFFGIQLYLRLVNYLFMAAEYFFPFFHVVLSEAATVQPEYK